MIQRIGIVLAAAALAMAAIFFFRSPKESPTPSASIGDSPDPASSLETFVLLADRDVSLVKRFGRVFRGSELDVGFRTFTIGTEDYNAALHFALPDDLKDKPIQSAVLKLYYFDAWGSFSNRVIIAHRVTENWSESNVRFTIGRDAAFATNIVGGREARWISWDATAVARFWAAHPAENFGVLLVPEPTGLNDNSFRFASTRTTNLSFYPALEITCSNSVPR